MRWTASLWEIALAASLPLGLIVVIAAILNHLD